MVDEAGSKNLTVALYAVALVRVDAGAEMGSLTVESDNGRPTTTTLYIDLNRGKPGDEDNLDVHGFLNENVYFITKKKQRVQLKSVRMKIEWHFKLWIVPNFVITILLCAC